MKGLTKTIVALALVMTLVATMGISAMAAGNYTTKTVYQAEGKISVEANATGLQEGDIVTYVATTDEANVNENTIVYINQAEADKDGKASFTYTTDVTNIDAAMFFGGSTEDTRVAADEEAGYAINVTVNDEFVATVNVPEQETTEAVIRKFELPSAIFAGVKVTGVTFENEAIGAFAADADTLMVSTNLIKENGTLNIIAEETAEFIDPKISASTAVVGNNLVAVAKAVSGSKFGIVMFKGTAPASFEHKPTEDKANNFVVLPALGKNADGIYAVELEGYAEFIGADVKVAAYAFNGEKVVVSTETTPIAAE